MRDEAPHLAEEERIDRWLWFARFFKSRSLAQRYVEEGRVRITRHGRTARIEKPSHPVRAGDVLTFEAQERLRILEVVKTGERRGPAAEAATLYLDRSPPAIIREDLAASAAPSPGRRPSKRERRQIEAFTSQGAADAEKDDR